jgi:AMMECR1 domain-containing protein
MPGMSREWAQFEHARRKNAQLVSFEPYALFRHEVHKLVEPGITWQPTGVPAPAESDADWQYDPRRAGRIAERVFDLVWSRVSGESPRRPPLPDNLLPELEGVFVTLYLHGQVVGCMGGKCRRPEEDLAHAVEMALADGRFAQRLSRERLDEAVVTVSFLYDPQQMGRQSPEEIAIRYRHGEQVLMVKQGTRSGILLPFVVVQRSLTPAQYVAEVIDKAGITRPPYQWVRFDCKTWLADAQGARPLLHGLPSEPLAGAEVTPTSLPASLSPNLPGDLSTSLAEAVTPMAGRLAGYLLGHRNALGLPSGYYRPFLDIEADEIELARRIHGVWVMARAGRVLADGRLTAAARQAVGHLLPRLSVDERGDTWVGDATSKALASEVTIAEVVFLMLSLCELARTAGKAASEGAEGGAAGGRGGAQTVALLAETLWRRIDRHGRISTHAAPPAAPSEEQAARLDALQDYLPAQALLGLASAAGEPLNTRFERPAFGRALGRYLHRFRYKRNWGQVCWLPQAAAGWWHASRDPAAAAIAYEVVDWALEHQQEKSGGFINEMQPDSPGYTTGVFLEGVAAALGLAAAAGEAEQARAERYRCACLAGLGFLDGLVYRERDRAFLPNPERAYGGLRISRTASDVRIDFVSHALNALVEMRLAEADSHC